MELFFDTETTGFFNKGPLAHESQPDVVQLGMILSTKDRIYAEHSIIVKPEWMFEISQGAQRVHGISYQMVEGTGLPTNLALDIFMAHLRMSDTLVAHNADFDLKLMSIALAKAGRSYAEMFEKPSHCTMKTTTDLCKLPGRYGKYKWPKLMELHNFLFGEGFDGAHDALEDVRATRRCYYKLQEM